MIEFAIPLPRGYRRDEILRFHARDTQKWAERVDGTRISKGVTIHGISVLIEVQLEKTQAVCIAKPDGKLPKTAKPTIENIAKSILGLWLNPAAFERLARQDPLLGNIIKRQRGLRIPQTGTVFEAITWAIMGQQISVSFAMTLRRAFIELAGKRHSSGLWCYPDAEATLAISANDLGTRKFSRAKSETILRVAQMTVNNELPLETWRANPNAAHIEEKLLAVKGIGPWTAHYVMLRGIGCPDCSLHGDAAIRAVLGKMHNVKGKVEIDHARKLLEQYRPWRSLAAAHLWASKRFAE